LGDIATCIEGEIASSEIDGSVNRQRGSSSQAHLIIAGGDARGRSHRADRQIIHISKAESICVRSQYVNIIPAILILVKGYATPGKAAIVVTSE
jgi:hypothetical protein